MQKFSPKMARTGNTRNHKKNVFLLLYIALQFIPRITWRNDCVMLLKFFTTALWLNKRKFKRYQAGEGSENVTF